MKEGILPQDIQDKRYSFSRFKRVMQRPPLNSQEGALLTTGVAGGLISGGILGYGEVLGALAYNKDLQTPIIEGAASTVGGGVLVGSVMASMIAINRGWGSKEVPLIDASEDSTTEATKQYLKRNRGTIAANIGGIGVPFAVVAGGMLAITAGHEAVGNVMAFSGMFGEVLGINFATIVGSRNRRKANASNSLE